VTYSYKDNPALDASLVDEPSLDKEDDNAENDSSEAPDAPTEEKKNPLQI